MSHLQEVALQAAPMLLAAVLVDAAGRIAGRPRKRPRGPPDLAPFASPQVASPDHPPSTPLAAFKLACTLLLLRHH